jgi:hypothetical protein
MCAFDEGCPFGTGDATGLGPPGLESADVLTGKIDLRLFGDGAQPAKLV